jgi:hypothetical protein
MTLQSPCRAPGSGLLFLVLLTGYVTPVEAQAPGSRRTTSAVGQLGLTDTAPPAAGTGAMRELVCRGKPGIDLRRDQEASPRDPRLVTMALHYQRSTRAPGAEYQHLEPGTCTWNPAGWEGVPPEPGVVYFDLAREAQSWSAPGERQLDTTINAAAHFPDLLSVPRYLADPAHYWTFYVDDLTNVSISFGARRTEYRPPTYTTLRDRQPAAASTWSLTDGLAAPVRDASPTRSIPTSPGVGERSPGPAEAGTAQLVRAPLRFVAVNTVLDRFTIQFTARRNASPAVRYSTEQPVKEPGTGLWSFPGGVLQDSGAVEGGFAAEVAGGTADGFRARYTAWSRLAPERGKLYHFVITIPAGLDQPAEQYKGQFTTVSQHARVVLTSVNLIGSWTYTQLRVFAEKTMIAELRPAQGATHHTGLAEEIHNAPDRLRISAHGVSWAGDPDVEGDHNSAEQAFDIGVAPRDRYLRIPFRLRSGAGYVLTLDRSQPPRPSNLMFEVGGYIEVTRR